MFCVVFLRSVQASIGANTYVVSGAAEQKGKFLFLDQYECRSCFWVLFFSEPGLQELLPEIITQLGPDSLMNLRKIAEQMSKEVSSKVRLDCGKHRYVKVSQCNYFQQKGEAGDSDDDVPSGNFDEAAAEA